MMRSLILVLCLAFALPALPAMAVQPDEVLDDPALELRARDISRELRCLVCRNESIDESNADLARDMRLLVRERLLEGDDNEAVLDFMVERYGEYVLLRPTASGTNIVLWLAGPGMLLVGLGVAWIYVRRRRSADERVVTGLTSEEETRLRKIMEE